MHTDGVKAAQERLFSTGSGCPDGVSRGSIASVSEAVMDKGRAGDGGGCHLGRIRSRSRKNANPSYELQFECGQSRLQVTTLDTRADR